MRRELWLVFLAILLGTAVDSTAKAQYTPQHGLCTGPVNGPNGPPSPDPFGNENPYGEFPALLHSNAPSAQAATCQWNQFTTQDFYTTSDMTLSIDIGGGSVVGLGSVDYVLAMGQRWNNPQYGTYSVAVPAGTNLRTLYVKAYAKSSSQYACGPGGTNCYGAEANVKITAITLQ